MERGSKREWVRNITLSISDDFMEVMTRIQKGPEAVLPTPEEFKEHLKNHGVVFGLVEDALKQALAPSPLVRTDSVIVARGVKPILPEQGHVEYFIDFESKGKPHLNADGSVDQKDLGLIIPVKEGDRLARKIPDKFGKPGRNVRGEPLLIPEIRTTLLPSGINTRPSEEDPNILLAVKSGNLVKVGTHLNIYEETTISGDIDFSTGNVSSPGSVRVMGSIRSGFTVTTGGNLVVEGDIEDANVDCGGNLVVRGGILGKLKNIVRVQGNCEARYVNSHCLRVMGNILLQEECINAKIECGGSLLLWRKGVLAGGDIYVFNRVDAKIIGSESGSYTNVYFGFDTLITSRMAEIKNERETLLLRCAEERKAIYLLLRTILEQNREPGPDDLQSAARKKSELFARYEAVEKLEQAEEELNAKKANRVNSPMVTVRELVHPGVKLSATTTSHFVREKKKVTGTYIVIGPDIVLSKLIESTDNS